MLLFMTSQRSSQAFLGPQLFLHHLPLQRFEAFFQTAIDNLFKRRLMTSEGSETALERQCQNPSTASNNCVWSHFASGFKFGEFPGKVM